MTVAETTSRPWWVTALVACLVSMGFTALALYLPPGRGTVVVVVGAIVFVVVLFKNPAFWRRRLAGTFIGASVVLAAAPKLRVFVQDESLGYLFFDGGTSIVVILFLGGLGVLLAALETLAERRPAGPRSLRAGASIVQGDNNQVTTNDVGKDFVAGDKNIYLAPPPAAAAPPRDVDFERYLRALLQKVSTLKIEGIASVSAINRPIEALYTPLCSVRQPAERRDGGRPPEDDPDHEPREIERVPLPELFREHPRLLLEGQPGAGKTTFIRFVACMLARDHVVARVGTPWRSEYLGLDPAAVPPLPAFIRLSALLNRLRGDTGITDDERWVLDILAADTCPKDHINDHEAEHEERRRQWDRRLDEGGAVLLFDGLDEVADSGLRRRVLAVLAAASHAWPRARIVVTSRPISPDEVVQLGFHKAVIAPFDDEEVARFVELWSSAVYDDKAPEASQESAQSLLRAIERQPELERLARSPVMLTCLCVIHWNRGRLPEGRARVYREVFEWMVTSRSEQREHLGFSKAFVEDVLQHLALAMMERPEGKVATIDLGEAALAVADDFPADREARRIQRAREWLRQECQWSGLIQEIEDDQIRFWHLTFQEYAAAWAIAGDYAWRRVEPHLRDPQWREALALLGGCLHDLSRPYLHKLMEDLLAFGERGGLADAALAIELLGHVQGPLRVFKYELRPALHQRQEALVGRVMAIFEEEGAAEVPVRTRVAAAEVIGRWGDPRLAEGVDNFVEVRGTGLRMGRYPVTVVEYGRFVAAGGYKEGRYWDEAGAAWKDEYGRHEPWGWEEQQEHPSRPVVGVSWHEARAFCRWLGERCGERVRLPTAEEWERAAKRAEGEYPWGSDRDEGDPRRPRLSDEHLANFKKSIGAPTPVGAYPAGAGPNGHLDLAGNVCEWCEDGPPGQEDRRWLKGGSWYGHDRGALVAAFCSGRWRVAGGADIGFRGVVAREPS